MSFSYSPLRINDDSGRTRISTLPSGNIIKSEISTPNDIRFNIRSNFTPSCSPPNSYSQISSYRNRFSSDDSRDDSFDHGTFVLHRNNRGSLIPTNSVDPLTGGIVFTPERIISEGFFENFAKDKAGCHFLQEHYPEEGSDLRYRLYGEFEKNEGLFDDLCKDVFANFFVQKMIEKSTTEEQKMIAHLMNKSMFSLCMNRYSCRVVQKAMEHLPDEMKIPLLNELHGHDIVMLAVDQNANHVVQKIFHSFDIRHWSFIIVALLEDMFFLVVENKYGCRVMQLAIELLSQPKTHLFSYENMLDSQLRTDLLEQVMKKLIDNCERLSSNEYANYVIQHVIMAKSLGKYRDMIIEQCLLSKLLSMSQEKFASHVVEKALEHACSSMLKEMMDEIFDGYVPHRETKKDAIDILLFHQYGNYVVQRMLIICSSKKEHRLDDRIGGHWMIRLENKIVHNNGKLARYSSGKKILDMLRSVRGHSIRYSSSRQLNTIVPSNNQYHLTNDPLHNLHTSFNNLRIPDQYL